MSNSDTHFEIFAEDPAPLAEFYRSLHGWRIEQAPGIDYFVIDTRADGASGISGRGSARLPLRRSPQGSVLTWENIMRGMIPMTAMAEILEINVRVGIEDNSWRVKGERFTTVQQVEQMVRLPEAYGRKVATAKEAREIMKIGTWYDTPDGTCSTSACRPTVRKACPASSPGKPPAGTPSPRPLPIPIPSPTASSRPPGVTSPSAWSATGNFGASSHDRDVVASGSGNRASRPRRVISVNHQHAAFPPRSYRRDLTSGRHV